MRFVFYLSRIVFAAAGGFLTQISTDGVVRFMTDFHGFAAAVGVAHRFCGFLCGGGGTRVFTEFVVFTHFCVDLCYYVLSVFIIVLAVVWNFWRNCGNFLLLHV